MCKLAPADLLARGMSRLVNMKLPNPPRPSRLPHKYIYGEFFRRETNRTPKPSPRRTLHFTSLVHNVLISGHREINVWPRSMFQFVKCAYGTPSRRIVGGRETRVWGYVFVEFASGTIEHDRIARSIAERNLNYFNVFVLGQCVHVVVGGEYVTAFEFNHSNILITSIWKDKIIRNIKPN